MPKEFVRSICFSDYRLEVSWPPRQEGDDPTRLVDVGVTFFPEGGVRESVFVHLDEDGIDHVIRVLRHAKKRTFGKSK